MARGISRRIRICFSSRMVLLVDERTEGMTNGMIEAQAIYKRVYGKRHKERLEAQTVEECGELIAAIMHHQRGSSPMEVAEEMADVYICLDMLKHCYDANLVDGFIHTKTAKLNLRLEQIEAGNLPGTRDRS